MGAIQSSKLLKLLKVTFFQCLVCDYMHLFAVLEPLGGGGGGGNKNCPFGNDLLLECVYLVGDLVLVGLLIFKSGMYRRAARGQRYDSCSLSSPPTTL